MRALRAPAAEARRIAAELTGCRPSRIEVELVGGDVETWRVRACGRNGLLVCEPTDDACFFAADEPESPKDP